MTTRLAEHIRSTVGVEPNTPITLIGATTDTAAYRSMPPEPANEAAIRALADSGHVDVVVETTAGGEGTRTHRLPLDGILDHLADAERRRLVATYRADVDAEALDEAWQVPGAGRRRWEAETHLPPLPAPFGTAEPACRCFRCGTLLTHETVATRRVQASLLPVCAAHAGPHG